MCINPQFLLDLCFEIEWKMQFKFEKGQFEDC